MAHYALLARLDELAGRYSQDSVENLFVRLIKQMWEVDHYFPPMLVMHFWEEGDYGMFECIMDEDSGDEEEESDLLMKIRETPFSMREAYRQLYPLIRELDSLRN